MRKCTKGYFELGNIMMNKSHLTRYLYSCAILVTSISFMPISAEAATIWAPTNEDTDFIQLNFGGPGPGSGISTNGGTLALFDDDTGFAGPALEIGQDGGHVVFSDNGDGSWGAEVFDVTNTSGGSITLSNDANFVLGISWNGGVNYFGDAGSSIQSSPDTYLIAFDGIFQGRRISGSTLAVDLAPIPLPASVWLLGSGLIGLAGVARRKKRA
jgi:hypothetical protein